VRIDGVEDGKQCEQASGYWDSPFCFQEEPSGERILTVDAGPVVIEGLSFQNGYSFDSSGAAISSYHSKRQLLSIINSIFTNNSAGTRGGAISNSGSISKSTFTNNSAVGSSVIGGGAVNDVGNISNSTFTNNSTNRGGGAIAYSGNISNSIFMNNKAMMNGGAIYISRNVSGSTFENNSANEAGGAIYGSQHTRIISNTTFINNNASVGGAVYRFYRDNDMVIFNSLFFKNISSENGGAVYFYSYESSAVMNSTFVNNIASELGGAFYGNGNILNSILFQNQAAGEANDIAPDGGRLHVDYTLANHISGAVDLGPHFIMGDPRFVDPENGNFRLLPDSPAINVGDPAVIDDYPFPTNDQGQAIDLEGKARIIYEGIDLGAYEFQ